MQAHTHKDAEGKDIFSMQLMEKTYTEKEPGGKALLGLLGVALDTEKPVPIGNYKGLELQVSHAVFGNVFSVKLVGAGTYTAELGNDVLGNLTRSPILQMELSRISRKSKPSKRGWSSSLPASRSQAAISTGRRAC